MVEPSWSRRLAAACRWAWCPRGNRRRGSRGVGAVVAVERAERVGVCRLGVRVVGRGSGSAWGGWPACAIVAGRRAPADGFGGVVMRVDASRLSVCLTHVGVCLTHVAGKREQLDPGGSVPACATAVGRRAPADDFGGDVMRVDASCLIGVCLSHMMMTCEELGG
jgi:hypothetical protein